VRPKASWAGLICRTCLHLKRQILPQLRQICTCPLLCKQYFIYTNTKNTTLRKYWWKAASV